MTFTNVISNTGDEVSFEEHSYHYELIKELKLSLDDFEDYLFIFYGHNGIKKPISRLFKHPKKVLICEGGENKMLDFESIKDNYLAIFAHYAQTKNKVVYSIPLGPFGTVSNTPLGLSERLYDISFCGCLNNNRVELASAITNIASKWITLGLQYAKSKTLKFLSYYGKTKRPGSFFHFNPDFNKGVDKDFFNYIVSHSKISICPKGWVNAETFRFYESMKLGCVVVCNKLPDRWYYKNAPVIQVDDWYGGYNKALELLKQPKELERLSKAAIQFYNKNLSGKAAAKYIIKKLNKL